MYSKESFSNSKKVKKTKIVSKDRMDVGVVLFITNRADGSSHTLHFTICLIKAERSNRSLKNVLYRDCHGRFNTVEVCQNSLSFTLKYKLHLHKADKKEM